MWSMVNYCLTEVKKEEIGPQDFSVLLSVLDDLESSLGDEYYNFVQTKTLELMFNEINQSYDMSLESIHEAFESIIKDEERHREILATLKDAIGADSSTEQDGTPKVRYQNPDSWDRSLPPATYNPA
jgi:hypothetical protein